MKKIIAVLLALVLVISMVACNKVPGTQDDTAAAGGSTAENTLSSSTAQSNYTTSGGNGTTGGTEATDPTGSTTGATQGATGSTSGTTDPTQGATGSASGTTDPTQGTESTLPTDTTTPPPTDVTDATEPTHIHEYTGKITAAACTTDGYTTHTCACGNSYTDSITKATGHSFGQWKTTKEPTVTATGTAERKCSNCSEKETKELGKLIDNHKHSYSSKVTKAATCSAEGITTFTCSCGDTYTESIAKTAHNYKDTVTAPTCTNAGYTTHTCERCSVSYTDNRTEAKGHSYSDKQTKAPTCTATGTMTHTCSVCGHSYTSSIAAVGHNYAVSSDTKATCTADGKRIETCKNCGDNKTVATYPATGHQHTRTEETNSTCFVQGYVKTICTDCGQTISTTEKALLSHNYTKEMILSDAIKVLQSNGNHDYGRWIAYNEWKVDVCANCGVPDMDSMRYAYTAMEAAEIMLGYVNDLRAEVYGSHEYDMEVNEYLVELATIRSEEIVINPTHNTTTYLYGASENLSIVGAATPLKSLFYAWKNSPDHYQTMIDKEYEHFGFAACLVNDGDWYYFGGAYGIQLFWDWYELYEYERIHGLL